MGTIESHGAKTGNYVYDHSRGIYVLLSNPYPLRWETDTKPEHGDLSISALDGSLIVFERAPTIAESIWKKTDGLPYLHGHIANGVNPSEITRGYIYDKSRKAYVNPTLHVPHRWPFSFPPEDSYRTLSLNGRDDIYYDKGYNMWRKTFTETEKFNGIVSQLNALKTEQTKGEEVMDIKDYLMFSMMTAQNNVNGVSHPINPMMLMLMMDGKDSKKGGMGDLLPLMLLSQGSGNNQMMQQFMMMSMLSDDKDPETATMMKNAMLIQMFPDANDVEKSLLAQGRIKTFLTMRFPNLLQGASEQK
jgi:hypothetical protein